jgi:protein O-GlcNAc transferase
MAKKRTAQLPKPTSQAPKDRDGLKTERVRRLVAEGAELLAARRPGEAVTRLAEAWELDRRNVVAAINLGGAYILQGKHDSAIPVLELATDLEPDNAMVWANLAAAYLGKLPFANAERQDKAIRAYEKALLLDPRAPHVHYNLGLIYLERQDVLRAGELFYSALETDPNDQDAQYWLDRISSQD